MGRSRQPRMFIKVVLPEPEAPISATISPRRDGERDAAEHRDIDFAQVIRFINVFETDQFHRLISAVAVSICSAALRQGCDFGRWNSLGVNGFVVSASASARTSPTTTSIPAFDSFSGDFGLRTIANAKLHLDGSDEVPSLTHTRPRSPRGLTRPATGGPPPGFLPRRPVYCFVSCHAGALCHADSAGVIRAEGASSADCGTCSTFSRSSISNCRFAVR